MGVSDSPSKPIVEEPFIKIGPRNSSAPGHSVIVPRPPKRETELATLVRLGQAEELCRNPSRKSARTAAGISFAAAVFTDNCIAFGISADYISNADRHASSHSFKGLADRQPASKGHCKHRSSKAGSAVKRIGVGIADLLYHLVLSR